MFDLLQDAIIRVGFADGSRKQLSLPEVYAAVMAGEIGSFSALRPHQRHAWHALLCQLGAVAILRSGRKEPPENAAGWRTILQALATDFPDDEPWMLVAPPDKPGFMQPVVGKTDGFKPLSTPDQLDMLVTSKNHDVKAARMAVAEPDDWLFALVTLQTSEGFLGAGNYGISRMNGGFSNRPALSLAPSGSVSAHIRRDLLRMVDLRGEDVPETLDYAQFPFTDTGIVLVWLEPWDGASSLSPKQLDAYYIEVCRRIRLVIENGCIRALGASSRAARISFGKENAGVTGDPWTPLELSNDTAKALTVDARGFSYKRMSEILFSRGFTRAPLQYAMVGDVPDTPYVVVARALARGQGKTEGMHQRRIAISPRALGYYARPDDSTLGAKSQERIGDAGKVRGALRFGLMVLFQNGPDDFSPRDPNSAKRAESFLDQFEQEIDRDFFDRLFEEIEAEEGMPRAAIRSRWLMDLKDRAFALLKTAETGSPVSSLRRYRAFVRAESAFHGKFYKDFKEYFPKDSADDHNDHTHV